MNAIRNSAAMQRARPGLLRRNSNSSPSASSSNSRPSSSGRPLYPAAAKDHSTILVSLPNSADSNEIPQKRRGGGRGREWMGRCHRLIQAMLELEESKPFRDPVNELMFPVSSVVTYHA